MKDLIKVEDTESAMSFLERFCKTAFCPEAYKNKPADAYIACSIGSTLGLNSFAALQGIAVINGKPSIYGDTLKALIMNSGKCEDFIEEFDEESFSWTCTIKRKGLNTPVVRTFSWNDAEMAGLTKRSVWQQYPKRMMQMRARGFAIRDAFPDLLNGLISREEAIDSPASIDTMSLLTDDDLKRNELSKEELDSISQKEQEKKIKKTQKKTDRLAAMLTAKQSETAPVMSEEQKEPEYIQADQESIQTLQETK